MQTCAHAHTHTRTHTHTYTHTHTHTHTRTHARTHASYAQGLVISQARELLDVNNVYSEEASKLAKVWHRRVKEYEQSFAKNVEEVKGTHEQQRVHLYDQHQSKLRSTPRPSKVGCGWLGAAGWVWVAVHCGYWGRLWGWGCGCRCAGVGVGLRYKFERHSMLLHDK